VSQNNPDAVAWWLVSRAAGIVALVLISISVLTGLAMAARVLSGPRVKRSAMQLHELLALASLGAIAVHGLALLGDHWLKPGLPGIAVPFAISYRPAFTAFGVIGGYLAVLFGPSFYLRRRIGGRRWRMLHRGMIVVWALAVVHTIGTGSDSSALWLRAIVLAPLLPVVYLVALRLHGGVGPRRSAADRECTSPTTARRGRPGRTRLRAADSAVSGRSAH
jgi:sulfoxide reductase heme-binding subunit YedZ